jgi:hypothetical protein
MRERAAVDQNALFTVLLVAIVAGSACEIAARIAYGYAWGASAAGHDTAAVVADLVNSPRIPNHVAMGFVG